MRVVAIIQARMGSTRFPGKVLAELQGKPILQHVIERVQKSKRIDDWMVAIPDTRHDVLRAFVHGNYNYCTGDESNVLERILMAAWSVGATAVVRINADCPLIDPARIDELVGKWHEWAGTPDYVGYLFNGHTAVTTDAGLPELVTVEQLERMEQYASDMQEHVTWGCHTPLRCYEKWIRRIGDHVKNTIDTPEDLVAMEARMSSDICKQS